MKAFGIMIVFALHAALSYGQGESMPIPTHQPESIMKLKNAPNPYPHRYNDNLDDMCLRYRAVETGGIALTVLGGASAVTGVVLLNKGNQVNKATDDNARTRTNSHLRSGGTAAIAVGAISMLAGIPMTIIGAVKVKKACGYEPPKRNSSYIKLQTDENGVGMALKF
jgi:hypothetical protein